MLGRGSGGDPPLRLLMSAAAESAPYWLGTVFSQMADGVLVLDPEGRAIESNPAAEQMLGGEIPPGCTPEDRRELFDIRRPDGFQLPPEDRPSAIALATGQPVNNIAMVVVHRDGTQRELSAS